MSLIDAVQKIPQRENAGSRSSNRFSYQHYWALDRLLFLLKCHQDFVLVMEFHDDVFVMDSSTNPQAVDFYQIKTEKESGNNFKVTKLVSNANNYPRKMSIAQKMISNYSKFDSYTHGLHLVSNKQFEFGILQNGQNSLDRDTIAFCELSEGIQKKIQQGMCAACKDNVDCDENESKKSCKELIYFDVSALPLNSYAATSFGRFVEYLIDQNIDSTSLESKTAYNLILSEIRRCNNIEIAASDFNDLVAKKSITRKSLNEIMEKLRDSANSTIQWDTIEGYLLAENMGTLLVHKIKGQWERYLLDAMDPDNLELQRLIEEVRALVLKDNSATGLEVLEKIHKKVDVKYSFFSREYIAAVILKEVYA